MNKKEIHSFPREPKDHDCIYCYRLAEYQCQECGDKICEEHTVSDEEMKSVFCIGCHNRQNGYGKERAKFGDSIKGFKSPEFLDHVEVEERTRSIPTREEFIRKIKEKKCTI